MRILIIICLLFCFFQSKATIQQTEILFYNKIGFNISEIPLRSLFKEDTVLFNHFYTFIENEVYSTCMSSSCWRGYIGIWHIDNDSLFLTELMPPCHNYSNKKPHYNLQYLFGKYFKNGKVFAGWVNDTLDTKYRLNSYDKYNYHFVIKNGILVAKAKSIDEEWLEENPPPRLKNSKKATLKQNTTKCRNKHLLILISITTCVIVFYTLKKRRK